MEDYVRWFGDISKEDIPWVGGKGANLGELTKLGVLVPGGFCITVSAYREFFSGIEEEVMQRVSALNLNDHVDLQIKATAIRDIVLNAQVPEGIEGIVRNAYLEINEPVAVRSSATAEDLPTSSFAGQHDTYLNVVGENQLIDKVKESWASLWTPRAIVYREKAGFDHRVVGMCVVVQTMVFPSVSGVMFTFNSVEGSRNEIVIESTFGLGEALVSGSVTPDSFIVNKKDLKVLRKVISEKKNMVVPAKEGTAERTIPKEKQNAQTLSDKELTHLAEIGLKIEDHYKTPQDIEWCIGKKNIYILQSRPVTDIGRVVPQLPGHELEGLEGVWTKSPLDERVQEPLTPFTWSIAKESIPSFFTALSALGFHFPEEEDMVRLFYGRPYLSKTELEKVFSHLPGVVDDFLLGGQAQISKKNLRPSLSMLLMGFRALLLVNQVHKDWDREYPKILLEFEKLKESNLKSTTQRELLAKLDHTLAQANRIAATHAFSVLFCEALYQVLFMFVSRFVKGDANFLCPKLVSGLPGNKTLETNKELWRLALIARSSDAVLEEVAKKDYSEMKINLNKTQEGKEFLDKFHNFLMIYGHRSPKYDLIFPSWGDDPDMVLKLISTYINSHASSNPVILEKKGIADREAATTLVLKNLNARIVDRIFPVKRILFLKLLSLAQRYMELRENQQFYIGQGYPIGRNIVLELGSRFYEDDVLKDPNDIFFLKIGEVREIIDGKKDMDLMAKVKKRRADFDRFMTIEPPALITKDGGKDWTAKAVLKGIGGSPGIASGKVRIISDINEFGKFKEGEILVAPTTNPSWTPLFMMAKAVITEVGGMLSHGAVVAREYQIPAVLGVRNASRILKDGQEITVDGGAGTIYKKDQVTIPRR
jgi:pyruvate,water dikinase